MAEIRNNLAALDAPSAKLAFRGGAIFGDTRKLSVLMGRTIREKGCSDKSLNSFNLSRFRHGIFHAYMVGIMESQLSAPSLGCDTLLVIRNFTQSYSSQSICCPLSVSSFYNCIIRVSIHATESPL